LQYKMFGWVSEDLFDFIRPPSPSPSTFYLRRYKTSD
jgi:hypothetical protein